MERSSIRQCQGVFWLHSLFILALMTCLGSPLYAFSRWLDDPDDHICHGYWHTTYPDLPTWQEKNINVDVKDQRFDFKEKIMTGKNFSLQGHGVILEAKTTSLAYEKKKMEWNLKGDVRVLTHGVVIEADELFFCQKEISMEAKQVRFMIPNKNIHGYAQHFKGNNESFELNDVVYTQCPPTIDDWSIQSHHISYQQEPGLLVIKRPRVVAHGETLIQGPTIRIMKNKVLNKMINIPQIKLANQGSIALRYPIKIPQEFETIELVPELNVKYGPGLQFNIQKGPIEARSFVQLLKHEDHRSWSVSLQGYEEQDKFLYDFSLNALSDQDLVYRYPDITPNQYKLYTVNYGSIKKKTPLGTLQFYGEKLYRFKEARQFNFEVIENIASVRLYDYQPSVFYHTAIEIFHRYNDKSYTRFFAKGARNLGANLDIDYKYNQYHDESYVQAQGQLRWLSPSQSLTSRLKAELLVLAKVATSEGTSPQLDTVVMPIHYESLNTLDWHQGIDWSSDGVILGPRLGWSASKSVDIDLAIDIAIKRPVEPLISLTQPYFTAFSHQQNLSPLGLRIRFIDKVEMSTLYDIKSNEFIYYECDFNVDFDKAQGYLSFLHHRYFPQDRLSEITERVSQLSFGYFTNTKEPLQYFLEAGVDLEKINLERLRVGWRYDHCCWVSAVTMSAEKGYNPWKLESQWIYGVNIKIELDALGFIQNGRDRASRFIGTQWHKLNTTLSCSPGYN